MAFYQAFASELTFSPLKSLDEDLLEEIGVYEYVYEYGVGPGLPIVLALSGSQIPAEPEKTPSAPGLASRKSASKNGERILPTVLVHVLVHAYLRSHASRPIFILSFNF